MTVKRVVVGLLVTAALALPTLGALGARPAEAGINRFGADYADGKSLEAVDRVGAD
jgi:hypothetical protein